MVHSWAHFDGQGNLKVIEELQLDKFVRLASLLDFITLGKVSIIGFWLWL